MSDLQFPGFHHLTAVSANIRENKRFYTQDLGMRLIKRALNCSISLPSNGCK